MKLLPRLFAGAASTARAAVRRALLDKIALPDALGSRSIFSVALLCSAWRLRILRSAIFSAIFEGFDSVVWDVTLFAGHRANLGASAALLSCAWLWPCFSASSSWLACQASDARCSPRMESVVSIPKTPDLGRWELAIAAPQAQPMEYCRQEAEWALDNAKLSGAMRLSSRCAHQLASAFLAAAEPAPNIPLAFLQEASRTLSSAPVRAVSIHDDLFSVSTWAKVRLLADRKPTPVDAGFMFFVQRWAPPIFLLGVALFFASGLLRGIKFWRVAFLFANANELSIAIDALRIEQASNAGRSLAGHGSPAPRKKSTRL